LINEVLEVQGYLNGNHITEKNLYRICYMLAKWFKEQGLSHIDIRQSIFNWGNKYGVFIKYNVNKIIYQSLEDKQRLKDNVIVKINQKDIDEINKRFDSKNTKLVALAILCYAKAYADRDRDFNISSVALGAWLGIDSNNLRRIYLQELIDFGYINKTQNPQNSFPWNNNKSKFSKYHINVEIHNSGNFQLMDNNITELYNQIF
jgi:hypothetical protein